MLLAMAIAAAACIVIGIWPEPLYALLPHAVEYHAYTSTHVVTQLQLLLFSALAFVTLMKLGRYPPEIPGLNLDTDWLYRRLIPVAVTRCGEPLRQWFGEFRASAVRAVSAAVGYSRRWLGQRSEIALTPFSSEAVVVIVAVLMLIIVAGFLVGWSAYG